LVKVTKNAVSSSPAFSSSPLLRRSTKQLRPTTPSACKCQLPSRRRSNLEDVTQSFGSRSRVLALTLAQKASGCHICIAICGGLCCVGNDLIDNCLQLQKTTFDGSRSVAFHSAANKQTLSVDLPVRATTFQHTGSIWQSLFSSWVDLKGPNQPTREVDLPWFARPG
ncbi:hypothetical protein KCU74_g47, partial [Aureobasidium melanogenum]